MNSRDGSNSNLPPQGSRRGQPRKKLELEGDLSHVPHADRVSTVIVHADTDEPTPPPGALSYPPSRPTPAPISQRFPSQALHSIPSRAETLDPDEPTPLPGSLTLPEEPTPPPGTYPAMPAPAPTQTGSFAPITRAQPRLTAPQAPVAPQSTGKYQPPPPQSQASYDAEHLTSTGFNYLAITAPPQDPPKKKGPLSLKDLKDFKNLSVTWLDSVDNIERLQYAGGGSLAGATLGVVLGFLNTFLQGWDLADGAGQIVGLMIIFALIFAIFCALRPRRVDQILARFNLSGGSGE